MKRVPAVIIMLVISVCIILAAGKLPPEETHIEVTNAVIACNYYDRELFSAHINTAAAYGTEPCAAAVPHYSPAMQTTADILKAVKEPESIETVYIIAPNHSGEGASVQVSGDGYYWEDAYINGDSGAASAILREPVIRAGESNKLMGFDHAASIQAPYVKAFFPNAKVVTVLLTKGATDEALNALAKIIYNASIEKSTFALFSVDFSHYLEPRVTKSKDRETTDAILSGECARIRKMTSANLDSPETICVMIKLAKLMEARIEKTDEIVLPYKEGAANLAGSYMVFSVVK